MTLQWIFDFGFGMPRIFAVKQTNVDFIVSKFVVSRIAIVMIPLSLIVRVIRKGGCLIIQRRIAYLNYSIFKNSINTCKWENS